MPRRLDADESAVLSAGEVSGVAVQAGTIHGGVTVAAGWRPPIPRELPPVPPYFTDRAKERAELRRAIERHIPVVVLVGLPGAGKSALAAALGHELAERFPDGQLHLRLRDKSPAEALGAALRSLGGDPAHLPRDVEDRARLYRSMTRGKRLLIVGDDAVSAEQVRPLIPVGPALVVVTCRVHLPDLLGEGANTVPVKPLSDIDAAALLNRLVPHAAADLSAVAQRCAGLPLTVVVVGGLMALAPDYPTHAVLSLLSTDPSVEDAMTASFNSIVAALPDRARRWTMHDATHDHARRCAEDLSDTEIEDATDRLIEHYLLAAAGADRALNPQRWRHATDVFERADDYVPTRAEGVAWWDAEGENVLAVTRLAHATGRHTSTWQLVETCKAWFMLRRPFEAWEQLCELGLASTRALDDRCAEAFMKLMATGLDLSSHQFARAEQRAEAALAVWREYNHHQGIGSSFEVLGVAAMAAGEPHRAIPTLEEAVRYHRLVGRARGIALMRRFLGEALTAAGRSREGVEILTEALGVFEEHTDVYQQTQTRISQARAFLANGEIEQAAQAATTALTTAHEHDHRYQAAKAHLAMADVDKARGRHQREADHLEEARETFAAVGAPEAEQCRERLAALETPGS